MVAPHIILPYVALLASNIGISYAGPTPAGTSPALLPRQLVSFFDPEAVPEQCKTECQTFANAFINCKDTKCACQIDVLVGTGVCFQCYIDKVPKMEPKVDAKDAQLTIDQIYNSCLSAGFKVPGSHINDAARYIGAKNYEVLSAVAFGAILAFV